jgi:outer membrane lipoprotein-sorting protein
MVFFDNLDQTTMVELYNVVVNEPVSPDRFAFVVPDGVDIVGTPAHAEAVDD